MRILILNWRCPTNPRAGGAEVFTHEIARRLVAAGDEVEWFSSSYAGAPAEERSEGIRFIRAGSQKSVHLHAYWRYRRDLRRRFDVVIDEVNTVPFFTPLWAGIPHFMLIHQLAREVWWYESRFPMSLIGYAVEPMYLRVYRRSPVFTVSQSTEQDLRNLGFSGPITVVPEGLEPITLGEYVRGSMPTFLYVGRMSRSKRIKDVIRAFAQFVASTGTGQLWLIGDGETSFLGELTAEAEHLHLNGRVRFLGKLPREEKHRLMAEAHAILLASVREGWGLAVAEASAFGTPAIVYNVPGLRDAVESEATGLVVEQSPEAMAEGMRRLASDAALHERLGKQAKIRSEGFSFDVAANLIRMAIANAIRG